MQRSPAKTLGVQSQLANRKLPRRLPVRFPFCFANTHPDVAKQTRNATIQGAQSQRMDESPVLSPHQLSQLTPFSAPFNSTFFSARDPVPSRKTLPSEKQCKWFPFVESRRGPALLNHGSLNSLHSRWADKWSELEELRVSQQRALEKEIAEDKTRNESIHSRTPNHDEETRDKKHDGATVANTYVGQTIFSKTESPKDNKVRRRRPLYSHGDATKRPTTSNQPNQTFNHEQGRSGLV